jgi:hypothetical protein
VVYFLDSMRMFRVEMSRKRRKDLLVNLKVLVKSGKYWKIWMKCEKIEYSCYNIELFMDY